MTRFCTFLISTLLLISCGSSHESPVTMADDKVADDSTTVRVAVLPTLDCLPLFLASEQGFFSREGLHVRLVDFTAQMDCDTAFESRRVDAMVTDIVRAERLVKHQVPLEYLTTTNAAWQLLTSKTARIRQLKQLDDKMLAMTRFSATDLLGDMVVDSARLQSERVFRIQVNDLAIRLNMLQAGIMDAVLLPEPQATAARNQKAFRVMQDVSQSFDLQLGAVVMRPQSLTAEQQKAFKKAYDEACDSINANGLNHYRPLITRRMGVQPLTVDSLPLSNTFNHAAQPREQDLKRVRQWLEKKEARIDVD